MTEPQAWWCPVCRRESFFSSCTGDGTHEEAPCDPLVGRWTIKVCQTCGRAVADDHDEAGNEDHAPYYDTKRVEVVPASEVKPLREALENIVRHHDIPAGESWEAAYNEVCEMARSTLEAHSRAAA
jgi:hypothetical protein